ncbi:ABC transporter permease subunit [Mycoplasma crocodyli]|uniref:ABC transporter permease subunit n=1 Tax=Mycoplasma crocodyli TaxID=50052 RepID=UPI0002FE3296|nr:ABC transporter permease [Mycoplasma crocodyli]
MTIIKILLKKFFLMLISILILLSISYFLITIFIVKSPYNNSSNSILLSYLIYFSNLFRFNFGSIFDPTISLSFTNIPSLFFQYFKWSILIVTTTFLLGIFIGYSLGSLLSYKSNSSTILFFNSLTFSFAAIPLFILAPIFINVAEFYNIPTVFIDNDILNFKDSLYSLIVPILLLLLGSISTFSSLTLSTITEILKTDFILYMKACGMSKWGIFWKGIFRNSWTKLISFVVPIFTSLITFSLIIERIFQIPGQSIILNVIFSKGEINIILFLILINALIIFTMQLLVEFFQILLAASIISKNKNHWFTKKIKMNKLFKKKGIYE